MRRANDYSLLLLLCVTGSFAAVPLAPEGRRAELIGEDVMVQFGTSRATAILQPMVASDAARVGLVYAVPGPVEVDTALAGWLDRAAQLTTWAQRIVPQTRYVPSWSYGTWLWWRQGRYLSAVADLPVMAAQRQVVAQVATLEGDQPAAEAALVAAGFAVSPAGRKWLANELQRGYTFVLVTYDLGRPGRGLQAPVFQPVRLSYSSEGRVIPFSEPQQTDDQAAAATARQYRLAVIGTGRYQPTYADGDSVFPDLALQYAHPIAEADWATLEPQGQGTFTRADGAYLCFWSANVPRTARAEDLTLAPDPRGDVVPVAMEPHIRRVPVPLDLPLLLVILLAGWLRRRRSRGTTSSATAPVQP